MTSLDNYVEIPPSSRISQVGEQILAEQARRALAHDSLPQLPPINLSAEPSTFGPSSTNTLSLDKSWSLDNSWTLSQKYHLPGEALILPRQSLETTVPFTDHVADKIYPGFGRIESREQDRWRLDYLDTRRCKGKSGMGMCFTLHWR